jgi:hypothetical protein
MLLTLEGMVTQVKLSLFLNASERMPSTVAEDTLSCAKVDGITTTPSGALLSYPETCPVVAFLLWIRIVKWPTVMLEAANAFPTAMLNSMANEIKINVLFIVVWF